MGFPTEDVVVSAMGGADLVGRTFGRGRQLALAVQKSLRRHSVVLNGSDLGVLKAVLLAGIGKRPADRTLKVAGTPAHRRYPVSPGDATA